MAAIQHLKLIQLTTTASEAIEMRFSPWFTTSCNYN